jgi:hypothetical protein
MRTLVMSCLVGGALLSSTASAADQIINLAKCCKSVTAEDLHAAALGALQVRNYNIEEDTPSMLVGEQGELKVEILITPSEQVVIRWKEGFGHKRDTWLRNLKTSFLWELAE